MTFNQQMYKLAARGKFVFVRKFIRLKVSRKRKRNLIKKSIFEINCALIDKKKGKRTLIMVL